MTEGRRRGITVTVLRDGELSSSTFRISYRAYRALVVGAVVLALIVVLGVAFYGPIARQAARVPLLEREVDRLGAENSRIRELAAALDSVEANYAQLRQMVGADLAPDPVVLGASLPVAPAIEVLAAGRGRRFESGPSAPSHWPLDERGYLTRGQVPSGGGDEAHPGIDVAAATGTLVRAAGGGTVVETGDDREYGLFVLIAHPDGYRSMYGHLSRVIAVQGSAVGAGEVIGRTGNTGRSSAPHLHFEIRKEGVPTDPMTMIRENR